MTKRFNEQETRITDDEDTREALATGDAESINPAEVANKRESYMRIWKDEKGEAIYYEGRVTLYDLSKLSKREIDRFGAHLHSLSTAVNWSMAFSYVFGRFQALADRNKKGKGDDHPDKDNGKVVLLKN